MKTTQVLLGLGCGFVLTQIKSLWLGAKQIALFHKLLSCKKEKVEDLNMNKKELFIAIKFYEKFIQEYKGIMSEEHLKSATETLVNYKREVRKKPQIDEIEILVKDYGVDGYVYKQDVTDFGYDFDSYTKKMIEETLEEHRTHCLPSQFDCTGQRFTEWNKLVKLGGRWWYYESVGFDV